MFIFQLCCLTFPCKYTSILIVTSGILTTIIGSNIHVCIVV